MERIVVAVGDIHGCLEEFDELLRTIQYNKEQMRLVLLGDLVDRGPFPVGCVRRAQELGVECIMGNHEEKHIRFYKHQKTMERTGKPNPMKPMSEADKKANEELSDADWTWLKALPVRLDLSHNWFAVHAGCEPRFTLEKQNPSQIMRVRYVDANGVGKALGPNLSAPEGTTYWAESWKGPESIVYGHCVHDLKAVRYDHHGDAHCVGIDTGCCFGGHLTALFMKDFMTYRFEQVQVKAKHKYYVGYGDE